MFSTDAIAKRLLHRDAAHIGAVPDAIGNLRAPAVVDAAERRVALALPSENARFHGGVILHGAMAVKMVRRQIRQYADVWMQPRHQVDLEGGQLQHIDAVLHRLAQQEHRGANVAANVGVKAGGAQHMPGQGGRRRLAIGAGDGDDLCTSQSCLTREDFGIADNLDSGMAGLQHRPVRFGMGERHAGAQHQGIGGGKIESMEIADRQALGPGLLDGGC